MHLVLRLRAFAQREDIPIFAPKHNDSNRKITLTIFSRFFFSAAAPYSCFVQYAVSLRGRNGRDKKTQHQQNHHQYREHAFIMYSVRSPIAVVNSSKIYFFLRALADHYHPIYTVNRMFSSVFFPRFLFLSLSLSTEFFFVLVRAHTLDSDYFHIKICCVHFVERPCRNEMPLRPHAADTVKWWCKYLIHLRDFTAQTK